jgi:hypothetical protein
MPRGRVAALGILTFGFLAMSRGADIVLTGGDASLTVSSATAGQDPAAVTNETCGLQWTTLGGDPTKKVTAQTNLAGPVFNLRVLAINLSSGDGSSAGEVVLAAPAGDLITGIPPGILITDPGTCTLRYTASVAAAEGTGSDNHIVTFTIVDQ